jgi:hypothetical protein
MNKPLIFLVEILLIMWCFSLSAMAQPGLPQRTATVSATQTLNFGDLTIISGSSGGTVSVDYNGSRTATGNIVLLNLGNSFHQAIFEFKLCPGRLVTINYSPTVTLNGSGSGNILLHIGPTNRGVNGTSFTSNSGCDNINLISVGGTIDVGSMSSNPPGLYTGSFDLIFIQQ